MKVQGFKQLNKWVDEQNFNIDEILLYNSRALILAFTSNIISSDSTKSTIDIITEEFFKLLKKMSIETQELLRMRIF